MPTYLIVANQTVASSTLGEAVRERMANPEATFRVLVPATPVQRGGLTWDEDEAYRVAQERLDELLERLKTMGVEATGEVGVSDPVAATRDAIRNDPVDEVILSTLPPGISRWLGLDVPSRLNGAVQVPVTVVVAPKVPATTG